MFQVVSYADTNQIVKRN